ncbi:conserved hypothetical protein [Anaeromyxobacter dehalogenans 2CP-1]|uniref:Lipoprotein n=1 Tax=Anaeromyxobacter dehalogenans (strain ATCC BAA-258 / DSM 21875 / 2CP-1) TaxID=455488 RepID=B8J5Q4_ANAD2|nr:hypothetical protein [Anaeromyxobacter dehalogenans]ACL65001.1 conserved hypothetical protein [Anaeromyxobacter dehalogenans 2CP-1]
MRHASRWLLLAAAGIAAACGGGGGGNDGAPPPARSFQLRSPDQVVGAGQELASCWYFRTPNAQDLVVRTFTSRLPAGAVSVAMMLTPDDVQPPGTQSSAGCAWAPASGPVPAYLGSSGTSSLSFPADDGTGKAIGVRIPAGQAGYLRVHWANASDQAITAHVELDVQGWRDGTATTLASPYVSVAGSFSIPASGSATAETTCEVPAGVRFVALTTRTYKHSVATSIADGGTNVFESADWSAPGFARRDAPPFLAFASGALTTRCEYLNTTPSTVQPGDDPANDELCAGIGWYFPATRARLCYDGTLLP